MICRTRSIPGPYRSICPCDNFLHVSSAYPKSTLVTTNRPFSDWHEVFPGAACVVSLVDRLVHNAEVIAIDGDSYRLKEANERAEQRARQRRAQSS